jgi:thiamine phosphate synthase YjbQ (UPF0047 family)
MWGCCKRAVRRISRRKRSGPQAGGDLRVENLERHRPVVLKVLGEIDRGLQRGVNVRQQKARNELCAILQREQWMASYRPLELPRSPAREGTVTLTTHRWSVQLAAEFGHADITPELAKLVRQSALRDGVLTVQMLGSTGAITTIEYESGVLSDLRHALDLLAPAEAEYAHVRWGDGDGFSHVRSALLDESVGAGGGRRTGPRDVAAGGGD